MKLEESNNKDVSQNSTTSNKFVPTDSLNSSKMSKGKLNTFAKSDVYNQSISLKHSGIFDPSIDFNKHNYNSIV